jgi:ABC-type sugar transport system substrate-binding protein
MKKLFLATVAATLMSGAAIAGNVGVSIANMDAFNNAMRNGILEAAAAANQPVQLEIAQDDAARQLAQIQTYINAKVDAIIVQAVDPAATAPMTKLANDAGIPIVYLNRLPSDVDALGPKGTFVSADAASSGMMATKEVCKLLGGKGDVLVMMGDLANQASKDVHDEMASADCSGMTIVDEKAAMADSAEQVMADWIASGQKPAAVIVGTDGMATGAISAMKAAGWDMQDVVVGGMETTAAALDAMKAGDLDLTVFQNPAGQGSGAVDAAIKLAKGEKVDAKILVPAQLVTPANMAEFMVK